MNCTFLPVISALAGAVVGGAISFIGLRFNNRLNAQMQAVSVLRAAFAPHLAYLRSTEGFTSGAEEIRTKMYKYLTSTDAAELEKFRFFVASKNIEAYDKACERYEELLHPGRMIDAGEQNPSEFFIHHIDNLLSHAKT